MVIMRMKMMVDDNDDISDDDGDEVVNSADAEK